MMKELILAIILGAILGFGATGTYLALSKSKSNTAPIIPTPSIIIVDNSDNSAKTNQNLSPTTTNLSTLASQENKLTIDTPENEALVSSSKLEIEGSTSSNSTIIIKTPVNTYSLTAAENGSFSQTVDIETGVNFIQISSIDNNDNQTDTQLIITYSTVKI